LRFSAFFRGYSSLREPLSDLCDLPALSGVEGCGLAFAAAALAQRAVLPLVMRARPSYAAAAMRKIRRQKQAMKRK